MDLRRSFQSVLVFVVFQNLTNWICLAEYVEDVCLWRPLLQIVDCDDTTVTNIKFKYPHISYTQLSLKGTSLRNLSFNTSFLPDLRTIDARNTSLGCRKVAPRILEVIDFVIVDEKSCYNTICCWKFRVSNESTLDSADIKEPTNGAWTKRALGMPPLQSRQQPTDDFVVTANHTRTSSHSIVNQNVGVNLVGKERPNTISVSTQVKVNFDENMAKKQSEKQTRPKSSFLDTDTTIMYSLIGMCCVTSLVSLSLSIYVICAVYQKRSCSLKDFSMPARSRSQGTVIL